MARKPERKPQRDDWVKVEEIELTNGSGRMGVLWQNLVTTERATLREGLHPLDNQNAITKISDAIQAVSDAQAGAEDEPMEETPEDRVVALFAEARSSEGRAQVIVSRIENDGTRTHCRKYDPAEFENDNFDLVRQEFGPGNYWFLLYATNPESGKFVRRSGIKLKLAPLPASVANSQANNNSELMRLLDRMDQRLAQVEKTPVDPMAQMSTFTTMFKMISDMMPKPAAAPDPMAAVKQLTEMLGVAKTIREEIDPKPSEPSDPLLALAAPAMDLIKTAIENRNGNNTMAVMPTVAMPPQIARASDHQANPVAQPTTRPNDVIETDEARSIEQVNINELIAAFNTMAKINASVENAAEIAYEKLPDDVLEAVLTSPQWWDLLSEAFPSVLPYRSWYEAVRAELVKIEAQSDESPAPAAPNGSAGSVHPT